MYTELQQSALTLAVGFRRPENPPSSTLSGGLDSSPHHFPALLLSAIDWPFLQPREWEHPPFLLHLLLWSVLGVAGSSVSENNGEWSVQTFDNGNIVLPSYLCIPPASLGILLTGQRGDVWGEGHCGLVLVCLGPLPQQLVSSLGLLMCP